MRWHADTEGLFVCWLAPCAWALASGCATLSNVPSSKHPLPLPLPPHRCSRPAHCLRVCPELGASPAQLSAKLLGQGVAAQPSTFLPHEFLKVESGLQALLASGMVAAGDVQASGRLQLTCLHLRLHVPHGWPCWLVPVGWVSGALQSGAMPAGIRQPVSRGTHACVLGSSHPAAPLCPLCLAQVQDEAAGMVVAMLGPQPGELLLDACAAPGGKTLFAAARCGCVGWAGGRLWLCEETGRLPEELILQESEGKGRKDERVGQC